MKNPFLKVMSAIAVCLSVGYSIAAQNKLEVVTGTVLDMYGAVISGARVILVPKGRNDVINQTTTNDEGKFKFSGVKPGEYQIEFSVSFIERTLRKQIVVKPAQKSQLELVLSLEPCFGETESGKREPLTDDDRAAITREIINLRFPNLPARREENLAKTIFSDVNIQADWLSPEQKDNISILPRTKIQDITEATDEFMYYSLSPMTRRGSCTSLSLNENLTVKGQLEDANMAGGGTIYEFRKINGKWTGKAFSSWIS